ncbi:MAG: hypothetical protein RR908_02775 [Rikenellaceae bacterium]
MNKLLLFVVALFLVQLSYSQETKPLTNKDVIDMVEMDLGSEIIISKIENSSGAFDVSLDALKDIKSKNVSSSIISAMIKKTSEEMKNQSEKTGIFFINDEGVETALLPTAFSSSKTRTLASAFSYGIASAKVKSMISEEESKNMLRSSKPTFFFYFSKFGGNQQHFSDWWFRVTSAPTEFVLVDLVPRKGTRELETGKANMWVGTNSGVRNNDVVQCEIKDLGDGKFSLTPKEDLPVGEYCFFFCGTIPQGGYTNQSVFDFSIRY